MHRVALLLVLGLATGARADELTCTITKIEKRVEVQKAGGPWLAAAPEMKLAAGDQIHTGFKATATVHFADGTDVTVKPMTMIKLEREQQQGNLVSTKLLLRLGDIQAKVHDSATLSSDFQVQTATCTASVRGTRIDSLAYHPALGTTVRMGSEGHIEVRTLVGRVVLGPTEGSRAASARRPPPSANAMRLAAARPPPATQFTDAENAAVDALGVPKAGPLNDAGSGQSQSAQSVSLQSAADTQAVLSTSGVDLQGNTVATPTRVPTPPLSSLAPVTSLVTSVSTVVLNVPGLPAPTLPSIPVPTVVPSVPAPTVVPSVPAPAPSVPAPSFDPTHDDGSRFHFPPGLHLGH